MKQIRTRPDRVGEQAAALARKMPGGDLSWLFTSTEPEAVAWRREQGQVDADIEALARDPGAEALIREMDARDVPVDEQIERLKDYFQRQERAYAAAE